MQRRDFLLDWSPQRLESHLSDLGEPTYRARQVFEWVFGRGVLDFGAMTNLPSELRRRLAAEFTLVTGEEVRRSIAADGTVKSLLRWADGATTECVMIPADSGRRTVCLSTQVGCDVGCRFCASGIGGALRNLRTGEVLEQALAVRAMLASRGERLSHVVFMGMGEPLANYRVTLEAIRALNASWGLGIAQRRITVSTVGLPKQIEQLAAEDLQITLALSLHAASADLRRQLIPWAERLDLDALLAACRTYFERTGREVTLEYCLLAGVNDRDRDARDLARVARDLRAHVNLMMYNPVPSLPFSRPDRSDVETFLSRLRGLGVNAHLRESRGLEADAACGQLRRKHEDRPSDAP